MTLCTVYMVNVLARQPAHSHCDPSCSDDCSDRRWLCCVYYSMWCLHMVGDLDHGFVSAGSVEVALQVATRAILLSLYCYDRNV